MVAVPHAVKRITVLGNHLPRHCGIATFTTHLADALTDEYPGVDLVCWR